jgi:hypothetical protein
MIFLRLAIVKAEKTLTRPEGVNTADMTKLVYLG